MANQLLQREFNNKHIPKYIQDIINDHLCISASERRDTYLIYNSKHATHRTIVWRYDKLKAWVIRNGGIFTGDQYNWNKEYCGKTDKFYEVQFFFPAFHPYKALFGYLNYYKK